MKTCNMNIEKKAIKELSPDDLNEVAGGLSGEVVLDSIYLNKLGLLYDTVSDIYTLFHWGEATSFVEDGWAKVGITCVTSYMNCNCYYYQGEMISRNNALKIARNTCIKGPQIGPMVNN
ncbi:MAG: hypothetical protein E7383_08790 [Ruminococcaceae bacterium]|nr:hypothetical protein [Oscillospiraceae bacterium]